jgi:hypothetical protein
MSKKANEGQRKQEVVSIYADLVRSVSKFPTRSDLASMGVSRDTVRHYFSTYAALREAAKKEYPELFRGIVSEETLTSPAAVSALKKKIKGFRRFVITTAVNGQEAHQGFLKSIQSYCKKNKAMLLIMPSHDPAHNLDNSIEWHFDEAIASSGLVFSELYLNSNIHLSSIRITAKQINPHTGLARFVQGEGSAIFGSPKQNLDYIPVSNVKFPHALMSTGAVTVPNYSTSRGNSLRSAFIAQYDHVIGAIIVEIQDDKIYHFRQVQSDAEGAFADLGKLYSPDGSIKPMAPALIMGDYHAGQHDPMAVKAWSELSDYVKSSEVLFHDLFNGLSVDHHSQHKIVTLARRSKEGRLLLSRELEITGQELDYWASKKHIKKLTIVKSNHDEFLDRWAQEARFSRDAFNFEAGCHIAAAMVNGQDALEVGLKLYGKIKKWDKLNFLFRDQDYKIADIECGAHGDKGPNGSRGTKANLENSYGRCVIGHSHTPGILRGVWQVGTTSLFNLDYNVGPSSWMHTSCLVYPNGQRQLINSIQGHWRLK